MTLQEAFVLWRHDLISHRDLVSCACLWLSQGYESPHLLVLASSASDERAELSPIVSKTANELEIAIPEGVQAYMLIAIYYSRLILSNELPPINGAKKIWTECANHVMGDSATEKEAWALLSPFIYSVDLWDEYPSERAEIEKDIVRMATRLTNDT